MAKTLKATTEYQTADKEKLKVYNIYNICVDFRQFKKLFKDYTAKEWAQTIFISTHANAEINDYISRNVDAGMLIITCCDPAEEEDNGMTDSDALFDNAEEEQSFRWDSHRTPVIYTTKKTTETTILIKQSTPVCRYMNTEKSCIIDSEVKLEDIAIKLETSKDLPGCAIVDKDNRLVNVITRHDTNQKNILNIILIGTSDLQTAPGLRSNGVTITSVIDNHKLPRFETTEPVEYYIRPSASVCTIVSNLFTERHVTPPVQIAGILLGGILAET